MKKQLFFSVFNDISTFRQQNYSVRRKKILPFPEYKNFYQIVNQVIQGHIFRSGLYFQAIKFNTGRSLVFSTRKFTNNFAPANITLHKLTWTPKEDLGKEFCQNSHRILLTLFQGGGSKNICAPLFHQISQLVALVG